MSFIGGSYDPSWGALPTTLLAEGLSPVEIEEAKVKLSSVVLNRKRPVDEEIRVLYTKVFPPNRDELIQGIRKEILDYTEKVIEEVLEGNDLFLREQMINAEKYIKDQLRTLRQFGDIETTDRFYLHCRDETKASDVLKEVFEDFYEGIPTSFPSFAHFIAYRKIGASIIFNPPSPLDSMEYLSCLVRLGERVAYTCLSFIFEVDKVGQVSLLNPKNIRIDQLRKLALAGHARSQATLASICFHNELDSDKTPCLDEKERRDYIQELFEHEVPHNSTLGSIIQYNRIGDLPFSLSIADRLKKLHKRARKGERSSFQALFKAYAQNHLEGDKLGLTHAEKLEKLEQLKRLNESLYNRYMADVYRDNSAGSGEALFELKLSNEERLQWLEEQALEKKNDRAQSMLVKAYTLNNLEACGNKEHSFDLKMSFKERIRKLKVIADQGHKDAQDTLLKLYQSQLNQEEQKVIENSEKETIEFTEAEIKSDALRWSFLSYNIEGAQNLVKRDKSPEQVKTLSFLYAARAAVHGNFD